MSLFEAIYSLAHRSAGLDQIIIFSASWLPIVIVVLTVIIVGALTFRDQGYEANNNATKRVGFIIFVPVIAWGVAHILKLIINSPRPALILDTVKPLFLADGNAFPSGHATFFFALTFSLYPFQPKLATLMAISAMAISLARVAAGVHWPIDILGGFILAGVISLIAWMITKTRFPSLT